MAAFLSALAAVSFSGCASTSRKIESSNRARSDQAPLSSRSLASQLEDSKADKVGEFEGELTEESLKNYFDVLWNDDDPSKEIVHSVEQLVRIFYRSQSQLRIFDHELDSGKTLQNISSYPKLLAYWQISHRALQRISYVYDRLLDLRTRHPRNSDDYKKAHRALSLLSQYFSRVQGSDRLALNEVSSQLKPIFDQYSVRGKVAHEMARFDAFTNTLFDRGEKVSDFARRSDVQVELDEKTQDAQDVDSDDDDVAVIEGAVNRIANQIRNELQEWGSGSREPQAETARFFPSSGSHGSISGSEYPKGVWSLTFDDGPSAKYTPMVLSHLKEHGFHSTFFELAMNVKATPKSSLALLDAGMELANHSYTHPQLPKLDDAHLNHEIVDSTNDEVKVWGEKNRPKLFRCPYGAGLTVNRVREAIAKQGFIHVFWNVDTLDWQDKNPDSVLARAKKQMQAAGRGIILFHDIHPQSVEASRMLMDWIKQQGLRHETVGAMIQEINKNGK